MSTQMLDDLDALRRRVREDRHAFAFPLFLFGTLILLAPLCYWNATQPEHGFYWDKGLFPQFTASGTTRYPDLVGWYWVLTIVGGLWLTSWWYRHRAQQRGVETDTRLARIVAAAVLLGFLVWQPLFGNILAAVFDRAGVDYTSTRIMLPVLFGGTVITVWAGQWGARRAGRARVAAVGVAAFFATIAFGALSIYLTRGHAALLIIAAALLVLARAERSGLLAVVSAGFACVALATNLHSPAAFYAHLGWVPGQNVQTLATQNLLLPGVILLAGGAAAVIGQRR